MIQRQMFICSDIEKCQEKANCCPHKKPHIKDEACVPRVCRYVPDAERVDCEPYDPEHPRAPVILPPEPVKTVEQVMKEKQEPVKYEKGEVTERTEDLIKEEVPVPTKEPAEPKKRAGKQRGKKGSGA